MNTSIHIRKIATSCHGYLKYSCAWVLGVCLSACGCSTVFTQPSLSASGSTLNWIGGAANSPLEVQQPFDLASIQPVPRAGAIPGDVLEITIWDLYEPGMAHTFPARMDADGQIGVPHLPPVPVANLTNAQIEEKLASTYRDQDLLKQPRILVRDAISAPLHIYVTGAVLRPGLIELPRRDATVFAALVAAGGLSRGAGQHVYVTDSELETKGLVPDLGIEPNGIKTESEPRHEKSMQTTDGPLNSQDSRRLDGTYENSMIPNEPEITGGVDSLRPSNDEAPPVQQGFRSVDDVDSGKTAGGLPRTENSTEQTSAETLSVGSNSPASLPQVGEVKSQANGRFVEERMVSRPDIPSGNTKQGRPGKWFDLTLDRDCDALKSLTLKEGDRVTVRLAAPPLRISGAVMQPGSYRAPANDALNLVDAIQMAGGFTVNESPLLVTITRPATPDRAGQRWSLRMSSGVAPAGDLPTLQPGDHVHVEPSAKAKVQSLVDAVLPKK